jgi:hypothetical protein
MNRNARAAANSTRLPLIVQSSRRLCNSPDSLEFPDFWCGQHQTRLRLVAKVLRSALSHMRQYSD